MIDPGLKVFLLFGANLVRGMRPEMQHSFLDFLDYRRGPKCSEHLPVGAVRASLK
jgi:hypothetical protein